MDILAIGEPLMEFSEMIGSEKNSYLPGYGGDTSNFAIAAARQGASVGYLTKVGKDTFGDQFLQLWKEEGVDTTFVRQDANASTGIYFITHTPEGHQFAYYRKGSAASLLKPEEITEEAILQCKLLHVSGISQAISESSCDAIFKAIEIARANNILISYDANLRLKLWPLARAKAVIHATAPLADVFLPSLEDVQQLTGLEDPNEIVDYYLGLGVKLVVLKLGKNGVMVADSIERHLVHGFSVDTVDATGAGDTFDGAFITKYLSGTTAVEAAKYANAAAALSTTGFGAVSPIPDKEEVMAFLMHETK
ncbi:sugar kinase [Peribacillus acanthi]|uniref:sugar kinase n=1 Tax=Peribacillus acanthi TaxID=2171554 RepID=UPI00196A20F4|nr:sugar kinase [Peribacillus acanthi]